MSKSFAHSAILFSAILFVLAGLVFWLTAATWAGVRSSRLDMAVPTEPIVYKGTFTLTQKDGTGCTFADAPFTSGQITLNSDWLGSVANGSLQGSGSGVRAGLRCGDTTGDMHWQQTYSANFSGSADSATGAVTLDGSLSGSNNVTWQNCKKNDEPIECPAGYSGPYTFPIMVQGTISVVGGGGDGTWQVKNISLTTTGDWKVTGPTLTATPTPTDTSTATATPTATPTTTSTPRSDLTVKNVELVQAIQCLNQSEGDTTCLDNSIPLVSYKQTAVRVYVGLGALPQDPIDGVTAQLHGFRNNQELADSPLTPVNDRIRAPAVPDRGKTNDTLNFRLPYDWLTGNLEIEIEVNPAQSLPEQNYLNNRLRLNLSFVEQPVLRLAYIPITYLGATPKTLDNKLLALYKMYPVGYGRVIYELWPGFTWPKRLNSENALDLIAELKQRYLLAGSQADQLIGWLPGDRAVEPLGKSDPGHFFGCWFFCGRVLWVHEESSGDEILAHELGHNLGRSHTNKDDSCGAFNPFTDWIYTTSAIQEYGFDPWTMEVVPNSQKDLMSDCFPKWVSPFTYTKLFKGQLERKQHKGAPAQPYLLIKGKFDKTGGGQLQPAYRFTSTLTFDLTSTGNDGCLVLQNSTAQTLAKHCFALDFHDAETDAELTEIDFVTAMPDPGGVSQILLQRNAADVDSLVASTHAPTLMLTAPTNGERWSGTHSIAWQASDDDGDGLSYAVLYSPDQGATWLTLATSLTQTQYTVDSQALAGGNQALIRVMVSDGFNSNQVDSPSFEVTRKGPQPIILTPATATEVVQGQSLLLSGDGFDREDEMIPDSHFQWHSDQEGDLGQGRLLNIALNRAGQQQITLTATDSDGSSGSTTVSITVRPSQPSLFLPLMQRTP